MERLVQFSIFLVNKHGVMSQVFRELAKAKINISGIALMDSVERGVLRLIVDDPETARPIFRKINIQATESSVLAVPLANRPGAVADLCERLSTAHITVGYMYCTTGLRGGKTTVFLKVPSIPKAVKVLEGSKTTRRDMKVKLRRPVKSKRR